MLGDFLFCQDTDYYLLTIFQLNYNLYTDDDCKENSENWNGNLKRVVEGKNKQQAIICVSRRLVNIVYGMLKNQTEYQEPER
ncbi:hypothetical protein BN3589_04093 [Clostridium sp. C105KSO14]|nr:hypothetical protein BN3589_04093 [Clostridium sp. C105KSO14]